MWWNRLLPLILLFPVLVKSQSIDSTENLNKKGLRTAIITGAAVYTSSLIVLNHVWYKNSEKQSFRFFNDYPEWKQLDKAGHVYSSFYISYGVSRGLQHYGVPSRKADLIGAISGFATLLPIEIFDGYSDAYGASVTDVVADAMGPALYLAQTSLWNEIRIRPKFSFHTTDYPSLRPDLLGRGAEQIIKDYNGQTYWLSLDIDKFTSFPKWLNLAIGYGAEGMIYGRDHEHIRAGYPAPFRQYYVSLDLDLSSIQSRSKFVNTLLFFVSMVKIPSPTIVLARNKKPTFDPFYY